MRALLRRLAGLLARVLRRAPPTPPALPEYRSRKGFELRSHGEVIVANWLDERGYAWEYEARVGGYTPDFMLRAERILIEYWGMKGKSRKYDAKIDAKRRRYRELGWDVISVERKHLSRLDDKLGRRLTRERQR